MEAGKLIGNVIVFGGIGAIGYLLFKKQKPIDGSTSKNKYTDENGNPLAKDTTFYKGVEFLDICSATNGGTKEGEVDVGDDNHTRVYFNKKDLPYIKDLCDNLPLTLKNELDQELSSVNDFGFPHTANTCNGLDMQISDLQNKILDEYKKINPILASSYEMQKKHSEDKFNKFNCRDKIEAQRTNDVINTEVKGDVKAEQSIGKSSIKDQNTYIILGGLVLLTGFYVGLKK